MSNPQTSVGGFLGQTLLAPLKSSCNRLVISIRQNKYRITVLQDLPTYLYQLDCFMYLHEAQMQMDHGVILLHQRGT